MNLSNPIGAEFREVRDATHEGQPARVVCGARTYATDPRDLWDALTSAERIPRWFLPISGELKPGGRYQLEGNAGGEITRCEPPTALDLTWEYGGDTSWVALRLALDGQGTRLTLEHTMLRGGAGEAHWGQFGPGATGVGWDLSFLGLALFLDGDGGEIDRDAVNAWMAAEAGKSFMRDCAEAWGKAHIAAGEAAAVAREMAQRTADAYTGG